MGLDICGPFDVADQIGWFPLERPEIIPCCGGVLEMLELQKYLWIIRYREKEKKKKKKKIRLCGVDAWKEGQGASQGHVLRPAEKGNYIRTDDIFEVFPVMEDKFVVCLG